MSYEDKEAPPFLHDVLIVGGGPCGLAVAARLCEHTPSALFTDEEHQRYHWIRKHGRRMSVKNKKTGIVRPADASVPPSPPSSSSSRASSIASSSNAASTTDMYGSSVTSVSSTSSIDSLQDERARYIGGRRKISTVVLDATGDQWMAKWNQLFKTFDISHLRSPMFFHVDPGDRDGLLAFAHEERRENELQEIRGCVGKEVSKHKRKNIKCRNRPQGEPLIDERDRKDYYTPSTTLFFSHCKRVISHYHLPDNLVEQESVHDIIYDYFDSIHPTSKIFKVQANTSASEIKTYYAKTVVLAVGAGNPPSIPGLLPHERIEGACHAMQIKTFPDSSVARKIQAKRETNIMVVGGGLTSAQIADLAIRKGVTRVWHVMRGPLKVKPFDLDLPWLGKFRNLEQAVFWTADTDEERHTMILNARDGGSITPRYHKRLKSHLSSTRLHQFTHTTLTSTVYSALTQQWTIQTSPPIPHLPEIDYIYYATGIASDFRTLPCLKNMNEMYPIESVAGLPCLSEDMMWKEDIPLFITGRLAGLRLGPGAPNLVGARVGAERIAWAMEEVLRDGDGGGGGGGGFVDAKETARERYCRGVGNRFECFDNEKSE